MTPGLPEKMVAIHRSLATAGLAHAFGGALALAWCVGAPRGTADIDVNILVPVDLLAVALHALPDAVSAPAPARAMLQREGQARLWWDKTPVDVFLNTTEFHEELVHRIRIEPFAGEALPFLDCSDLAVFKAFFARSKDWVDLEEMVQAGTLDVERVLGTLVRHLGGEDPRIERLRSLTA
ncbi:hypothetical protein BH23ACT9_BH23ACT9_32340 [soil metagenome]